MRPVWVACPAIAGVAAKDRDGEGTAELASGTTGVGDTAGAVVVRGPSSGPLRFWPPKRAGVLVAFKALS